ncbi:radical SAM protein [Candidatus Leptofilum sp.]|uniref:radical SAM protein n=1 Tax=Candidatus Leptofilum sp. TaxID=3241576 RepID=UPI003B5B8C46
MNHYNLPFNEKFADPLPITSIVVKVASRCNIQCTYCYMYEHADQTWRDQPPLMSEVTIQRLAFRLAEYAEARNLKRLLVIVHGGEPLLIGAKGLSYFFETIHKAFNSQSTEISFGIQSNGILVTNEIIKVVQSYNARIGISIDGPKQWNDIARVDKKGLGTFDRVMASVDKLRNPDQGDSVFGGFLTVANPQIPAKDLFEFFDGLNTPAIDFLLPDYHFDTYPFDKFPPGTFGNWYSDLFDVWLSSGSTLRIRSFQTLMKLVLGGKIGYDALGSMAHGVLVVETDGTYHALDVLKTAYHGATQTGKSLTNDPIIDLEMLPLVLALTNKKSALNEKCLNCELIDICGGGYLPHRYSKMHGFDSKSVYCTDLQILINHIRERLSTELASIHFAKERI